MDIIQLSTRCKHGDIKKEEFVRFTGQGVVTCSEDVKHGVIVKPSPFLQDLRLVEPLEGIVCINAPQIGPQRLQAQRMIVSGKRPRFRYHKMFILVQKKTPLDTRIQNFHLLVCER
jgi:hypothetical protein